MTLRKIGNLYRPEQEEALKNAAVKVRGIRVGQTPADVLNEYFMEKSQKLFKEAQRKESVTNLKTLQDIPTIKLDNSPGVLDTII